MNNKIKFWIATLGIYIFFGFITDSIAQDSLSETRRELSSAIHQAKNGERRDLQLVINYLTEGQGAYASAQLLEDYISFLKDEDGQAQQLGALGLLKIKSPKGTEALVEYLKDKDYGAMQRAPVFNESREQKGHKIKAFSLAVRALGEIGDTRAIPLLAQKQETYGFGLYRDVTPVHEALVKLGAVTELADIQPDTHKAAINIKANGLRRITDPSKIPELKKIATDSNRPFIIRDGALAALANINPAGISSFFLDIFNDLNCSVELRESALIAAGKTKDSIVEKPLLKHAQNRESEFRLAAIMGLVLFQPDKYFEFWLKVIMDPSEDMEFREKISHLDLYIPSELLAENHKYLYESLNAADKNGRPIDELRLIIWHLINSNFGPEPPITLTTRNRRVTGRIQNEIRRKLSYMNPLMDKSEISKKVEQKIPSIISIHGREQETPTIKARNNVSALRQKLSEAVRDAKQGNRRPLTLIIDELEDRRRPSTFAVEELVGDYISYLKDKDGQVQWLGAQGLFALESPKSTDALIEFVKELESAGWLQNKETWQSYSEQESEEFMSRMYQMRAFIMAVLKLGEIGDSRAVPVIARLHRTVDLELEWGFPPLQSVLAMLGAINELVDIPPDADKELIYRVARGLKNVKDPRKINELKAVFEDMNQPEPIRKAARSALVNIRPNEVPKSVIDIINDTMRDKYERNEAAITAGKTKNPIVEKPLLAHAHNRKSPIRDHAIVGLALYDPDKYLDLWFGTIMDSNEHWKFRETIARHNTKYIPADLLLNRRDQLYSCLNAADKKGRPVDEVRVVIWELINLLYSDQPFVTLTTREYWLTHMIKISITRKLIIDHPEMFPRERDKKVEAEMKRIITLYNPAK